MRDGATWRRVLGMAATALLAASVPVRGQVIDLSPRPEPPAIGESSAAIELWSILEREISPLIDRERAAPMEQRPIIQSARMYRIIAADLLARGHEAGRAGSLAVLTGARLADHREDIDAALQRAIASPPPANAAAALDAIGRFNRGALELVRMPEPTDLDRLDEDLRGLLAPLAEAIALLEDAAVVSHWPRDVEVTVPGLPSAGADPEPISPVEPAELRARIDAAALRDDTRALCLEILDFIEGGLAFPDLAPAAQSYAATLDRAVGLADALEGATWLPRANRDTCAERLHEALVLFRDPQTRRRGREKLDRLDMTRRTIERISVLNRRGVDLKPVRAALLSTEALIASDAGGALNDEQFERLVAVLDRMVAFRGLEDVALRRELRQIEQQLRRRYLDAEAALVREIEAVTAHPAVLADPAFGTLLIDHAQRLEDLVRIRRVPDWIETIDSISPEAGGRFDRQARKMCQWLLDDNRRPDGIRAIQQFEQQFGLFATLPFEDELRRPSPELAAVTGGREDELLDVIAAARETWAQAWGRGDAGGDAAARMLTLYRLMQAIADVVELGRLGDDASALNRWAAWFMPRGAETRTLGELRNRLKLATDAAVGGDADRLLGQLDRMDEDLPLVRLVARLAQVLAPSLRSLPAGAIAAMGQGIHPPPPDAWWLARRAALADLCRYAMERDHAGATGRVELESALSDFINDLADDLLRALGERRSGPPTLIGFDGSDPNASDIDAPVRRR